MAPSERSAQRGFTLVELLVTILITAILMTMIGGILISILSSKKKVEARDQGAMVAQAVLQLLARDVRAFTAPENTTGTVAGEDNGEEDRFGIVAFRRPFNPPVDEEEAADTEANLFEVTYFARQSEGDAGQQGMLTLFRSETLGFDGDVLEGEEAMEIADNLTAFDVQYWAPDAEEWADEWEEETPPVAVKFTLKVVNALPPNVSLQSEEGQRYIREYTTIVSLPWEPEPREGRGGGRN